MGELGRGEKWEKNEGHSEGEGVRERGGMEGKRGRGQVTHLIGNLRKTNKHQQSWYQNRGSLTVAPSEPLTSDP